MVLHFVDGACVEHTHCCQRGDQVAEIETAFFAPLLILPQFLCCGDKDVVGSQEVKIRRGINIGADDADIVADLRMMFSASVLSSASLTLRASVLFNCALWLSPPHEDLVVCVQGALPVLLGQNIDVFFGIENNVFSALRSADSRVMPLFWAWMRMLFA